ncbi:hypothetical protein U1Q18_046240, partial [Sarracenia purpurea var. burkii]
MEEDFVQCVGNEVPEGDTLSEAKISPSSSDVKNGVEQERSGFKMETCVLRADEGKTWPRRVSFERPQERSQDVRFSPNKSADDLEEKEKASETISPNSPKNNKAMAVNRAEWKSEQQRRETRTMGNVVYSQALGVMQNMGEPGVVNRGRGGSGSRGGR